MITLFIIFLGGCGIGEMGSELTMIHGSHPAVWPNWLRSLCGSVQRRRRQREKGGKEGMKKIIRKKSTQVVLSCGYRADPLWHSPVVPSFSCPSCFLVGHTYLALTSKVCGFPCHLYTWNLADGQLGNRLPQNLLSMQTRLQDPPPPPQTEDRLCLPRSPEVFGI